MTGEVISFDMMIEGSKDSRAYHIAQLWTSMKYAPERVKWEEDIQEVAQFVYATDTTTTSSHHEDISHTTHRPKLAQLYDTLMANYQAVVMPDDHWFQFVADTPDSDSLLQKKKLESFLRTRHTLSHFPQRMESALSHFLLTGNCIGEVRFTREIAQKEGSNPGYGYIGPEVVNHDPRRVVWNTKAKDFRDSPIVIQSLYTKGDIARMVEDTTLSVEYREALQQSRAFRQALSSRDTKEFFEGEFAGFGGVGGYFQGQVVEILTFYGDLYDEQTDTLHRGRRISIIDRCFVVEDVPLETWDGKPLIFHATWRKKAGTNLGMGPFENLLGMQYRINYLENRRADALDKQIWPDRLIKGIDATIQREDGGIDYHVFEQGDVRNLPLDTSVLTAKVDIQELEAAMELFAGAPREAMGVRSAGEKTKFEVSQLQNASGRLFQSKISSFEREFLEPILNAEIEVCKDEIDSVMSILVDIDDELIWEQIGKADFKITGRLVPKGATHYAKQAQLVQELQAFHNVLAMDQELQVHFPANKLAEQWNQLLGFGGHEGVYEKFGRIAERVELAQMQQAAEGMVADTEAADPTAMTGGMGPDEMEMMQGQPA